MQTLAYPKAIAIKVPGNGYVHKKSEDLRLELEGLGLSEGESVSVSILIESEVNPNTDVDVGKDLSAQKTFKNLENVVLTAKDLADLKVGEAVLSITRDYRTKVGKILKHSHYIGKKIEIMITE